MVDHRPVPASRAGCFDEMPHAQILKPEGVARRQLEHRQGDDGSCGHPRGRRSNRERHSGKTGPGGRR
jgi:hypothetical protein